MVRATIEAGFTQSTYVKNEAKSDLRHILSQDVIHYRNRLIVAILMWLPVLVFAWILPYTVPSFLTKYVYANGNTLYIFLMLIFSTIIQFGVGYPFYRGAYKSLRNKSANMDVLVVLGTTAAWLYGVILCFLDHGHSSMDSINMPSMPNMNTTMANPSTSSINSS